MANEKAAGQTARGKRIEATEVGYAVEVAPGKVVELTREKEGYAIDSGPGCSWFRLDHEGLAALRDACCAILWHLDPQGQTWPPVQAPESHALAWIPCAVCGNTLAFTGDIGPPVCVVCRGRGES